MSKTRSLLVGAAALLLPLGLVACSDGPDSSGEVSRSEAIAEFKKGGADDETAECMADALIDADFSKDTANKIADANILDLDGADISESERAKVDAYMSGIGECMSFDMSVLEDLEIPDDVEP